MPRGFVGIGAAPLFQRGPKQLILEFMLANIGRVLESKELQVVSGWKAEWARRVRELRDEQGYQILSHKDRADLKPGQHLLDTAKRRPAFQRGISEETRAFVLERNGYTCQTCGLAAGDKDPFHSNRTIRLTMGHIKDKSKGGDDESSNLRAVCTNCNEGCRTQHYRNQTKFGFCRKFAARQLTIRQRFWTCSSTNLANET